MYNLRNNTTPLSQDIAFNLFVFRIATNMPLSDEADLSKSRCMMRMLPSVKVQRCHPQHQVRTSFNVRVTININMNTLLVFLLKTSRVLCSERQDHTGLQSQHSLKRDFTHACNNRSTINLYL